MAFADACAEDVADLIADLTGVTPAVAAPPDLAVRAGALLWPGTPNLPLAYEPPEAAALAAAAALGAEAVALVAADAPDLPDLLLGKVFRGLGSADLSVLPADGGGLVALGVRLPAPPWWDPAAAGLDTPDALDALRATAPTRGDLAVGPGWHRLRTPADLARLDPGLEGWDVTRALLAGTARPTS